MTDLAHLERAWNEMAETDAMWFILSDPARRTDAWEVSEFLDMGRHDVDELLVTIARLSCPVRRGAVLDFGCGIGRISRALSPHFENVVGIDISSSMIKRAREINRDLKNVEFHVNKAPDLSGFSSRTFDLVYSNGVLQHLPSAELQARYIEEFVRTCKIGGLVFFQLPDRTRHLSGLLARRRPYGLLRRIGFSPTFLHRRLAMHQMRMTAMKTEKVVALLHKAGAQVLEINAEEQRNRFYCATPSSSSGATTSSGAGTNATPPS